MPAGKPVQTAEQRALRVKGYNLWLAGAMDNGKRMSVRAIAMTLGVTVSAVQYWREHDKWDARVNQALIEHTVKETESASTLANLLRASLYDNMKVLNEIIRDKQMKPLIKIKAISEYADICHKLKVVQPDDLNQIKTNTAVMAEFKDDLDGNDGRGAGVSDGDGSGEPTIRSAAASDADQPHNDHDGTTAAAAGPIDSPAEPSEPEPGCGSDGSPADRDDSPAGSH
jgi:predicted transcriptional regulator